MSASPCTVTVPVGVSAIGSAVKTKLLPPELLTRSVRDVAVFVSRATSSCSGETLNAGAGIPSPTTGITRFGVSGSLLWSVIVVLRTEGATGE